jgi:hypothetical protein
MTFDLDAYDDADRIRRKAEEEAQAYLAAARERADAFAEARVRRLRELSDRLIATAETVERRFGEALDVKAQLDDLVTALGATADHAAREARAELDGFEPDQFGVTPGLPARPSADEDERLSTRRGVQVLDLAQSAHRGPTA